LTRRRRLRTRLGLSSASNVTVAAARLASMTSAAFLSVRSAAAMGSLLSLHNVLDDGGICPVMFLARDTQVGRFYNVESGYRFIMHNNLIYSGSDLLNPYLSLARGYARWEPKWLLISCLEPS